jgi:hypothetical protein
MHVEIRNDYESVGGDTSTRCEVREAVSLSFILSCFRSKPNPAEIIKSYEGII